MKLGEMKLVIIESPYAGEREKNILYARRAVKDSLSRGEAPIASHLLYTQEGILDDSVASERQRGIDAGLAWIRVADMTAVYVDRGISNGMNYGIAMAMERRIPIEYRSIGKEEEGGERERGGASAAPDRVASPNPGPGSDYGKGKKK